MKHLASAEAIFQFNRGIVPEEIQTECGETVDPADAYLTAKKVDCPKCSKPLAESPAPAVEKDPS